MVFIIRLVDKLAIWWLFGLQLSVHTTIHQRCLPLPTTRPQDLFPQPQSAFYLIIVNVVVFHTSCIRGNLRLWRRNDDADGINRPQFRNERYNTANNSPAKSWLVCHQKLRPLRNEGHSSSCKQNDSNVLESSNYLCTERSPKKSDI